ncbi:MAG: type II toxin-antitoxin system PrlF family antitoxin [Deltaproteobacteria bacterium]|nr:type II toxin-antitoxin system PrlF family antitoxin [Candidatus Tharpella aukensis]
MGQLSLYSDSTLTNRYQTTIPEMVRKTLHLKKRDKIRYTLQTDGSVLLSRANNDENDPLLTQFLTFLANDISQNPQNVSSIDSDLIDRIRPLVSGVETDLSSPLSDEDD